MSDEERPRSCDECGRRIVWRRTRLGVKAFDAETIPREYDEAQLGYVELRVRVRGTPTVIGTMAVPARDVAERRLEGVDRVLLRHLCQEYRVRALRDQVAGGDDWQALP